MKLPEWLEDGFKFPFPGWKIQLLAFVFLLGLNIGQCMMICNK
uniref:Uncharacterized protein n=1 Tax=viral metagenome TaxID=1070528 RepID=A0A6M3LQ21_9ZZZZ